MSDRQRAHLFVENFFRQEWRNAIAALAARFGVVHLAEIENAVQTAMVKALDHWSHAEPPRNPGGWIYRVARNEIIDEMRKRRTAAERAPDVRAQLYGGEIAFPETTDPIQDDVLSMIFVCCHPSIKVRDSVVLTLRVICGLGFHEIASGLCMSEEAVRKSLTRCKRTIARSEIELEVPDPGDRSERLGRVLQIVYLLFNEGYFSSRGDQLVRDDLCRESERLLELLRHSRLTDRRIWALSALVAFQASRLDARTDSSGRILLLVEQDRSRWDQARVAAGFSFLQQSLATNERSPYHLEAAIAACHASAVSYDTADWPRILSYYDELLELTGSPVVALNRAVAVMELEGPAAALAILEDLTTESALAHSCLLPSVIAECHRRLGDKMTADSYLTQAIALSSNKALTDFWSAQIGS